MRVGKQLSPASQRNETGLFNGGEQKFLRCSDQNFHIASRIIRVISLLLPAGTSSIKWAR